jgi:outer membrane protein OmpA-like peptidoglycan-associated protein
MKKIIYIIGVVAMLLGFVNSVNAQRTYIDQVKVSDASAVKKGDDVIFNMNIVLDELKIASNDMVMLVPVLKSNVGNESKTLPAIVIAGGRRDKIIRRNKSLNEPPLFPEEPQSVILRKNGTAQTVSYQTQVPFESWMRDAHLKLGGSSSGCANCDLGSGEKLIAQNVLPKPYVPVYKITYIEPEVEPVKNRADKYTAALNFRVDKYNLDPNYMNNADILAETNRVVSKIMNNKDLTVSNFDIVGYASPEASVAHNKMLAENRAKAFADYLSKKFGWPRNKMDVKGYGEDWEKTRQLVVAFNLPDKNEILNIIDKTPDPDARDAKLMKLSGGETYRRMLSELYPKVRRTEYTVSYVARAFNVEEARKIIKTNPKLLSLNEMYLVAQSYPADSKEFKEVFDIAARLYPDDPIAIVNSAAVDIEGGNNQAAIDRLMKIKENPHSWNNIGVAYARKGDISKAKEYFTKAAGEGDNDARVNLEELRKVIENL